MFNQRVYKSISLLSGGRVPPKVALPFIEPHFPVRDFEAPRGTWDTLEPQEIPLIRRSRPFGRQRVVGTKKSRGEQCYFGLDKLFLS